MLTKKMWAAVALSLLGTVLFAVQPLRHLTAKEVVIAGNERVSPHEIIKRSDIIVGSTSMLFSASEAKRKILESPWIRDVRIKKLLHGKIRVEVSEEKPFCMVVEKEKGPTPYYINGEGKKLGRAEPSRGLDFPVISSEGAVSPQLMLQAVEILTLSKSSQALGWSEISEIAVEESSGIRLLTLDRRFVTFGKDNMTSKWHKVEKIIVHSRKNSLSERDIDISSGKVGVITYDS